MSAKKNLTFALSTTIILGPFTYCWFDISYRINQPPLVKIKSETMTQARETALKTQSNNPPSMNQPWTKYVKPDDQALKKTLTPLQYRVTQKDGTERAFSPGNLNDEKRPGIFVDILSGTPLFSSKEKFDSSTGWPSFTQPIDPNFITTKTDYLLIYSRTEVRSKFANNHLGHRFNDGPEIHNGQKSTGQRWCINGAALRFIPLEDMVVEGYGEYVGLVS